jgi:hypothetical protein
MPRTPIRLLAPALVVPLLLMSACGSGDSEASAETKGGETVAPATFCDLMQEVEASIDDAYARTGDPEDAWARIEAAFDAIDEAGVPSTFPAPAVDELDQIERSVRESTSLAEYEDALAADPPTGRAVDTWVSANCT